MKTTVWDRRFIGLASNIAEWSKDPSTQCGAVIVDDKQRIVSTGFNGFSRGISDDEYRLNNRPLKYQIILHAEVNALMFANQSVEGCTIYVWPFSPCPRCAAQLIQSGIKRVVSVFPKGDKLKRWGSDIGLSRRMFEEAGVSLEFMQGRSGGIRK